MDKRLLNNPDQCHQEMLGGVQAIYPCLHIDEKSKVILLKRNREERVAILAGSLAGQAPFPIGFIANNMLTGAVIGDNRLAPNSFDLLNCIFNLSRINRGGILAIVLNYRSDMLHFASALENAQRLGIRVERVVVADDVGFTSTIGPEKRGLSGIVLVLKIAGEISAMGGSLEEVAFEARCVCARMGTMGFSLGNKSDSNLRITEGKDIIGMLLRDIFSNYPCLLSGGEVVALINNVGGVSPLEMNIIASEVENYLTTKMGLQLLRIYTGTFITSLDEKGFQITILNVARRSEWLLMLDKYTDAPAWIGGKLSYSNVEYEPPVIVMKQVR